MATRIPWLALALMMTVAGRALGEPYMAVREGFKCSGCHVNQTGGGKRSEIVSTHARDLLHYPSFEPLRRITAPAEVFTGEIHKYVGIGANLRVSETAIFQEKDGGGTVDNNTAFRGRLDENDIDVNEAVGFLEVRLIPDWLTFYVDQRFQPQTDTREAWGMLRLPYHLFVKGGRMFLPYGLQLQDDSAFIRGGRNGSVTTDFSFNAQEEGVEIGFEPGPFSVIAAVTDGAPRDRDVRVTASVYGLVPDLPVVRSVLIGGSASRVGPPDVETITFGFFAGTNLGPFTYLGEVDFRRDDDDSTGGKARGTFIHYSELDWLLFEWLNLKLAFDYADDDGDISKRTEDSENRVSIGIEPFLSRFLQLRLFYRVSNGVESRPDHNQDLWLAEAHVFF